MRKKFFTLSVLFLIIGALSVKAFANDPLSWYCKRNSAHLQPIADKEISFIEEYGGYYLDHSHGDKDAEKIVYLTFDAGYENGNVSKILDILKDEQVSGAFFVLKHLVIENTALVERMLDEGHIVANHTSDHTDMTKIENIDEFRSKLSELEEIYKEKTGRDMPKYFRPPEGRFTRKSMSFAHTLGYKTIFWSIAYADWDNNAQPSLETARKKLLDNIHNGAIILLHPTSKTNTLILGDVIRALKSQGYRFGTLDELCKS